MKHGLRNLVLATAAASMAVLPLAAVAQTRPLQTQQRLQLQIHDQLCVRPGVTLNGRAGPGVSFNKLLTLQNGTRLTLIERNGDWLLVQTPSGRQVWVYGAYVTTQPAPLRNGTGPQGPRP